MKDETKSKPLYYKTVWVVTDEIGTFRKAFPSKKDALRYCQGRYTGSRVEKYVRKN